MRIALAFYSLLLLSLVSGCKGDSTPKPEAYMRIDPVEEEYVSRGFEQLGFEISTKARIHTETKGEELWLTITYPHYNARLYCTYLPITPSSLGLAVEDSYKMAYSHTVKASGIEQKPVSQTDRRLGGMLYLIHGNVATPRQFFLTDSLSHFFRASLYFDARMNADSLKPVIDAMDENISRMIGSIQFDRGGERRR